MVEITPQARQAFETICDVQQLRQELLHGVDVMTAGSAQPPDPAAEASTIITTAQIEIAPSETSKSVFVFVSGGSRPIRRVSLGVSLRLMSSFFVDPIFEGVSADVRDLAAPLLQKHGLLKPGKETKGTDKKEGQLDLNIGANVDI